MVAVLLAGTPVGGSREAGSTVSEVFEGTACDRDTTHAALVAGRYDISCGGLPSPQCPGREDPIDAVATNLFIAVTEINERLLRSIEDLAPEAAAIETVEVLHTEAHLDAVAAQLRDELKEWADGVGALWSSEGVPIISVAVDPSTNSGRALCSPGEVERAAAVAATRYGSLVTAEVVYGVPSGGSINTGRTDAARIHVGSFSNFYPGRGYYVYRDSAAQLYHVHYRAFFGDFVKGDDVCKSGIETLFTCGPIVTINGSCCTNKVQMQVDTCGDRGDSGAPMYVPNGGAAFAVAIQQGANADNGCHPVGQYLGFPRGVRAG